VTFFKIFSDKKQQPTSTITVDHREKNSLVCSELVKLGFTITFEQLPVADYIVKDIAVERKTINDLKSSIINKRIISQLHDLQQYKKKFLIIEGINDSIYEGIIHENALRGFLISVGKDYNVPILYTLNEKDTARYLLLMYNKKEKSETSVRAAKIMLTSKERIQYILEGFPGIGPATAKKLLNKFKSLQKIMNATSLELTETIGKKAQPFNELMRYEYHNNS
jgi:Fanconi anemia group M protein